MYKETAKLILYRSFGDHSILSELSKIFHDFDAKTAEDAERLNVYTHRSRHCLIWRPAMALMKISGTII